MKQRINIARSLLHHPDILILDEPTLGLDPQTTRAIHEFILELSREGITVVLTTHDMTEAESISQRIGIMDKARIVALDTTKKLKRLLSGGDTTRIDIEIINLNEAMLSGMKELENVVSLVQKDSCRVGIRATGSDTIGAIVNIITSAGGQIRAINTVEPNLEDVFLYLTGREMRDRTGGNASAPAGHHQRRKNSRVR